MGTLIQFLKKYVHVILLIVLLSVSLTVMFRFHVLHQTTYFNSTRKLSAWLNASAQSFHNLRNLSHVNNALVNENISLRSLMRENYHIIPQDTFFVQDTLYKQRYVYMPATVIGNSLDKENNYITINIGASSGVNIGMGVFSPEGIVGIVEDVSENFALVMSMLHSHMVVSPKIKELDLSQGKVTWSNRNPDFVFLSEINRYEKVEVGQKVVTSPYSKNFPENIMIGKVVALQEVKGSFLNVKLKLSTNFSQLREVYVVKDLFKEELATFKIEED